MSSNILSLKKVTTQYNYRNSFYIDDVKNKDKIKFIDYYYSVFRKSTFFNVLTKSQAAAENFPFCTIDPNESRHF